MIEFYQGQTSTNSGKVRLVLEEKNIPYREIDINLEKSEQRSTEYLALNPNGVVPTIMHEGQVIIESSIINEYLDDYFDGPSLKPRDPLLRARMRQWPQMVDLYIHPATWIVTYVTLARPVKQETKSDEELEAEFSSMADQVKGQKLIKLQFEGTESAEFRSALVMVQNFFQSLNRALSRSEGAWLLGQNYTLADVAVTPWLMRFENITFSEMWSDLPELSGWWQEIKERPNFVGIVSKNLPRHALDKRSELGSAIWPEVRKILG